MDDIKKVDHKKKKDNFSISGIDNLSLESLEEEDRELTEILIEQKKKEEALEDIKKTEKVEELSSQVKVPFDKFVQLVATHDFESILDKHPNEEIVMSTSLLTDLANAHEEQETEDQSKLPLFFVVGLAIGIVITYLLIKF